MSERSAWARWGKLLSPGLVDRMLQEACNRGANRYWASPLKSAEIRSWAIAPGNQGIASTCAAAKPSMD